jgi:hypothetical protein
MTNWRPDWESARLESVTVFGVEVKPGDRVRLWPQRSADIIDMALKGRVAVIEAIERDFEDQVHLAVVVDDDPGREFGMLRQPGHRFFFFPDEIEPLLLNHEVAHEQ